MAQLEGGSDDMSDEAEGGNGDEGEKGKGGEGEDDESDSNEESGVNLVDIIVIDHGDDRGGGWLVAWLTLRTSMVIWLTLKV